MTKMRNPKKVGDTGVQLFQLGSSGDNYVFALSKRALIHLRNEGTAEQELLFGDKKIKLIVMQDSTFKKKLKILNQVNAKAKQAAEKVSEENKKVDEEMK